MTSSPNTNSGIQNDSVWWKCILVICAIVVCYGFRTDGYARGASDQAKITVKLLVMLCDENKWQTDGCKTADEVIKKWASGEKP